MKSSTETPAGGNIRVMAALVIGLFLAGLDMSVVNVMTSPKGAEGMYSALNTVIMPVGAALGSTLFSGLYAAGAAGGVQRLEFSAALWGMLAVVVVLAAGLTCRRRLSAFR